MDEAEPEVRLPYGDIMSLLGPLQYSEYDPDIIRTESDRMRRSWSELRELVVQLRKCHECVHARRFDLIQDVQRDLAIWHCVRQAIDHGYINMRVDGDHWVMHDEGMADLVLDIAFDKNIYVVDGSVHETYLHDVYSSLFACFCGYYRMVTTPGLRRRYLKGSKSFLERANRLCMMLWSNKDQVLRVMTDTPHGRPGPTRFAMLGRLLALACSVVKLHHVCYKQVQQLTYGRAYHIGMYVWTRTRNLFCSETAWQLISVGIGEQGPIVGSGSNDNIVVRQFLEEAVVKVNRQGAVAAKLSYLLRHSGILDHILARTLSIFHMMVVACPSMVDSLTATSVEHLRASCAIAFEREFCSGDTDSDGFRYEVVKTSFYLISFTHNDFYEFTTATAGHMTITMAVEFWQEALRIKLLPLVQSLIQLRVTQIRASADFLSVLVRLLTICRDTAARIRAEAQRSHSIHQVLHNVFVFMHSMWYPVKENLQPLKEKTNSMQPHWVRVGEVWEELGLVCGLSSTTNGVKQPMPWRGQISDLGPGTTSRVGCSWIQCLCSLAPHHKMKVCKGCWQVRYCGSQCQIIDWYSGRHYAVCSKNRQQ